MTTHKRWTDLAAALVILALSGCSTYVNIPPQTGDVAQHNPNTDTVEEISIIAARAVLADNPIKGPFRVVLPKGTLQETYERAVPRISADAVGSAATTQPFEQAGPVIDVRQIRIRGWRASVDVIRPISPANPDAGQQVVTVDLKHDVIAGWGVESMRTWRTSVDKALLQSPYNPENPQ